MTEREQLLSGLRPVEPGWAEFEERFLARGADCPLVADLAAFAGGDPAPPGLAEHLTTCSRCRDWVEGYRAGKDSGADPAAEPPAGSLLAALRAAPAPLPGPRPRVEVPPKVVTANTEVTNILALMLAGEIDRAVTRLNSFLAGILHEVGLDPNQAGEFCQFLRERLPAAQKTGLSFVEWLRAFARERLGLDDLPSAPPATAWEGILVRSTLRQLEQAPEQPEPVRQLIRAALEQRVERHTALLKVREQDPVLRKTVSDAALNALHLRVRKERKRAADLFGLN